MAEHINESAQRTLLRIKIQEAAQAIAEALPEGIDEDVAASAAAMVLNQMYSGRFCTVQIILIPTVSYEAVS